MSLFTLVIQAAEEAKPEEAKPKGPKEYEASWLKNAGKIWRDASGRFGGGPNSKAPANLESGGPAKKMEPKPDPAKVQGPPLPTVGDKISMSVTSAKNSVDKMLLDSGIKDQYNKAITDGGAVINSIPGAIEDFKKDPQGSFEKAKAYVGQKLKDAGSAAKTFAETVLAFVSGKAGEAKKAISDKASQVSVQLKNKLHMYPLLDAYEEATKAAQKSVADASADFAAKAPSDQVAASALAASGGVAAVGHGVFTEEVLKAEKELLDIKDPKEREKKIKDLVSAYEGSMKAALGPVKKEGRQKQMDAIKKGGQKMLDELIATNITQPLKRLQKTITDPNNEKLLKEVKPDPNKGVLSPRSIAPSDLWHPAVQASSSRVFFDT